MVPRSRADDRTGYPRLVKNPGQCELGESAAFVPGAFCQLSGNFNSPLGDALGVNVFESAAAVGRQVTRILVATGKNALGQGTSSPSGPRHMPISKGMPTAEFQVSFWLENPLMPQ